MNTRLPGPELKQLPFDLARVVDQACDRFEGAWRAGERPRLEDLLATAPEAARAVLLRELIALEVGFRRESGEDARPEEYTARFPEIDSAWLESLLSAQLAPPTIKEISPAPSPADEGWPAIPGYEILGVLGEGGMGVVYQARHQALHRLVALKRILPGSPANVPVLVGRFRMEAEAQARLQHPNIVQIFEVGDAGGRPYLALEYLDGGSLDKYLAGNPQPPRTAARLVEVLARTMHVAHQQNIVHRDLKPANILLQSVPGAAGRSEPAGGPTLDLERWTPKITDFGVAKFLDAGRAQTQTGSVLGTPSYMAPEQARGRARDIGPATDVYALGAILYELLTGRPPFKGTSPVDTLEQVVADEPVSPTRLQPKVPRDLVTICLKCLAKEPRQRYASALALADDLRRFQAGEPILGRRPGPVRQLASWCRRKPGLAAASGLAALALVAVVAVSVLFALFQSQAASTLRAQQAETKAALAEKEAALQEAKRLSLLRGFDKGLLLCRQGDPGLGMNVLARSLEMAPAGTDDLQRSLRANLAAWRLQLHPLVDCLPHPGGVRAAAFSPDGRLLATASGHTVRLWKMANGRWSLHTPLPHQNKIQAVAFSPDSRLVVTGSDDGTRLWSTEDEGKQRGGVLRHGERNESVWAVAFSPDGRAFVTGGDDGKVRLWDTETRTLRTTFLGHGNRVQAVAFSRNGQTILTGSRDQTARLWDVATGMECHDRFKHPHWVAAVAFSADGRSVLTGCHDNNARLWDIGVDKPPAIFPHKGQVTAVAFQPATGMEGWGGRGGMILTGSADYTAQLWDPNGTRIGAPLHHGNWVMAVAFHPAAPQVLTASLDGTVRLWELARPTILPHASGVNAAAFGPRGSNLFLTATQNGSVQLWHADKDKADPIGRPLKRHSGAILCAAFSPDGTTFVTASMDKKALLWDVARRQPYGKPMPHPAAVYCAAYSPDGKTVLTGGADGKARLWDARTGDLLRENWPVQHQGTIESVAFSPRGEMILTTGGQARAQRWKADTGEPVGEPLAHKAVVSVGAFSPDGRMIATGSGDRTARLWDAETGKPLGKPLLHEGKVQAVSFSPDSQMVLTGSTDGTARLWDVATGLPIGPPLQHQGPVREAIFHPDGQIILTGSHDKTVRLWAAHPLVEGGVERILLWTQVLTGVEVDQDGEIRVLDSPSWHQRRQRLEELGGPPLP